MLTAKIEAYPENIIRKLGDMNAGLPAISKFLPSIAEVHELADKFIGEENNRQKYTEMSARKPVAIPGPREPFRPFPKLWAAFADEPDVIERLERGIGFTFDRLEQAGRLHAMRGKDEARAFIMLSRSDPPTSPAVRKAMGLPDPPPPKPRVKPTEAEMDEIIAGLKSPKASPSRELIDLVAQQHGE